MTSRGRRRAKEIRALANRIGFNYLDTELPQSLSLQGTELGPVMTSNVMEGNRGGLRIAVFDCQPTNSRANWNCTTIAAQGSSESLISAARFDIGLTVERSADWALLYQKSAGLMPLDDIESYITSVGT